MAMRPISIHEWLAPKIQDETSHSPRPFPNASIERYLGFGPKGSC